MRLTEWEWTFRARQRPGFCRPLDAMRPPGMAEAQKMQEHFSVGIYEPPGKGLRRVYKSPASGGLALIGWLVPKGVRRVRNR